MIAVARAHPNVALVKYWGKRDKALNLPATGSLSVTLSGLFTETRVETHAKGDEVTLTDPSGEPARPEEVERVRRFLDRVRLLAQVQAGLRVTSCSNFPRAAGLASSASGFAALALAATRALGLSLSFAELAELTRLGSGSAPRSLLGGFVEMQPGLRNDGSDAVPVQLLAEDAWPLSVLVAVTTRGHKEVGSTFGMELSAQTSPFYRAWLEHIDDDLATARAAVGARDIEQLGEVSEHNCLKMHAVGLAARPGLIYWNAATVEVMRVVRALRAGGSSAFFTIDAGPQVKVLVKPEEADAVAGELLRVAGVREVLRAAVGRGAHLVETT